MHYTRFSVVLLIATLTACQRDIAAPDSVDLETASKISVVSSRVRPTAKLSLLRADGTTRQTLEFVQKHDTLGTAAMRDRNLAELQAWKNNSEWKRGMSTADVQLMERMIKRAERLISGTGPSTRAHSRTLVGRMGVPGSMTVSNGESGSVRLEWYARKSTKPLGVGKLNSGFGPVSSNASVHMAMAAPTCDASDPECQTELCGFWGESCDAPPQVVIRMPPLTTSPVKHQRSSTICTLTWPM